MTSVPLQNERAGACPPIRRSAASIPSSKSSSLGTSPSEYAAKRSLDIGEMQLKLDLAYYIQDYALVFSQEKETRLPHLNNCLFGECSHAFPKWLANGANTLFHSDVSFLIYPGEFRFRP